MGKARKKLKHRISLFASLQQPAKAKVERTLQKMQNEKRKSQPDSRAIGIVFIMIFCIYESFL
jgi:hypothetical protein